MVVSNSVDLEGLIRADYATALSGHHNGRLSGSCAGCHKVAEGVLAGAMRRWEVFLQEVLLDEMCGEIAVGYGGSPAPRPRFTHTARVDAQRELLRSKFVARTSSVTLMSNPANYLLLHNPRVITSVADYWVEHSILSGSVSQRSNDITRLLTLRHGLSHGTRHAQVGARSVMLTYDPARTFTDIGEFLASGPPGHGMTWLDQVLLELFDVATFIRP